MKVNELMTHQALSPSPTKLCVKVGGAGEVVFGGHAVVLIAGPCAVETEHQMMTSAQAAQRAGAKMLRGGAYKPRTSPHAFQGLGEPGLALLRQARRETGLPFVTEAVCVETLKRVAEDADMVQIGARNMQNFALLRAAGRQSRPVMLKRGLSATYAEWLFAAEYIAMEGNTQIVLCERGIRTYEPATRNTLDLSAIPILRMQTSYPVIVDPSHATGRKEAVHPMALAGVAGGADGVMVDIHPAPKEALCDGPQALSFASLLTLGEGMRDVAAAVGRA